MNKKSGQYILLLVIAVFFLFPLSLLANKTYEKPSLTPHREFKSALHRLDFRIEGKSCAACLLAVQRKLNSLPGIKQAVVMLKRPYGVSVIYQETQIKEADILAVIKDKEPNVKIMELKNSSIINMPSPVIPPFVPTNGNTK